jgi:hypothetical protein
MKRNSFQTVVLIIVLGFLGGTVPVGAEQISVPLSFDLDMVKQGLLKQIYTEAGETVTVVDDAKGCQFMSLSQPQMNAAAGHLCFISTGIARAGVKAGNQCIRP